MTFTNRLGDPVLRLTITIAWLAQELPLTDVSIDMRILNDVARRSENPPDYIPRGYTAGGKRIDR